jgi:hypothetical protein
MVVSCCLMASGHSGFNLDTALSADYNISIMPQRFLDIGVEYRGRLSRLISVGVVTDTENQDSAPYRPRVNRLVRAGRIPLPLRRSHVFSDMFKIILILTFAAYGR